MTTWTNLYVLMNRQFNIYSYSMLQLVLCSHILTHTLYLYFWFNYNMKDFIEWWWYSYVFTSCYMYINLWPCFLMYSIYFDIYVCYKMYNVNKQLVYNKFCSAYIFSVNACFLSIFCNVLHNAHVFSMVWLIAYTLESIEGEQVFCYRIDWFYNIFMILYIQMLKIYSTCNEHFIYVYTCNLDL